MVTIIMHNIPEGILTFITSSYDKKLGLTMAIMIAMHNIPEGISIAVPIYYSTKKRSKVFIYSFISALSEPLGGVLAFLFFKNFITNLLIGILISFVSGIMINISIFELLKEAKNYKINYLIKIFYIIGFILTVININLIWQNKIFRLLYSPEKEGWFYVY